jgi:hypothetical protein
MPLSGGSANWGSARQPTVPSWCRRAALSRFPERYTALTNGYEREN